MYNALVMPYFNYCSAVWADHLIGCDKNQKLCDIFRVDCAIR